MEVILRDEWKLSPDNDDIGENESWFLPERFPKLFQLFYTPTHYWAHPLQNMRQVWLKKEFEFKRCENAFIYLVFFGSDQGKIWLNGHSIGKLEKSQKKQVFEVSRFVQEKNTLIIKFENLKLESSGIWKYVYLIEGSSIPMIAKTIPHKSPKWIDEATLYCIYTRNFTQQGTFKAAQERLTAIKNLGANTIWFLPIHPTGAESRKGGLGSPYAIRDYYEVNPEFGTKEDFKQFVRVAHEMGMRVIIDLVINHTAIDSVMNDIDPKFYKPDAVERAAAYGWTDVKELDYSYPPTRTYIADMMRYWVREFDIDGFRCDVAFLIPLDFWNATIQSIRDFKPDIMMLAEADVPELHLAGFDLTYEWQLLALFDKIDKGYFSVMDAFEYISAQFDYFPPKSKRMICSENHDTERGASQYLDKTNYLYQILKYIIPGVPLIYNGEEIGAKKRPDLFDKDAIDWSRPDTNIRNLYNELSKLKSVYPCLNYSASDSIEALKDHNQIRVTRCDNQGHQAAFIIRTDSKSVQIGVKGKSKKTLDNPYK